MRTVPATTVLFWQLIITAERDGYIEFATVITLLLEQSLEQFSKNRGGFWLAGAMDDGLWHCRRGHESAEYAVGTRGFSVGASDRRRVGLEN